MKSYIQCRSGHGTRRLLLSGLVVLSFCPASSGLSAQKAGYYVELGLKNSPDLEEYKARLNRAESEYNRQSVFKGDPVLSLGYSNVPLASFPSLDSHAMSGISIGITQTFAFPWEDHYRKKRFQQYMLSAREAERDARQALARDIETVYHRLQFLSSSIQLLGESKVSLEKILNTARAMVASGKMNSAQLLKLQADIGAAENEIIESRAAAAVELAGLEKLCGRMLRQNEMPQPEDWLVKPADLKTPGQFEVTTHPLYRQVSFTLQAEEAARGHQKAALFPDVTVGASYRLRQAIPGKDSGEDFISVQASTPLPLFYGNKNRHSIAAATAAARGASSRLKQLRLDLESSWRAESARALALKEAYTRSHDQVVPYYLSAYRAQLAALSSGRLSLIDVMDAYRQYLKVRLNNARLFRDLQINLARLGYLNRGSEPGRKKDSLKNEQQIDNSKQQNNPDKNTRGKTDEN